VLIKLNYYITTTDIPKKKVQVAVLLKTTPERTPVSIAGEHAFTHAEAMLDLQSQRNHAQ
jgi:hypothetical protein